MSAAFVEFGTQKFLGQYWTELFRQLGPGDWFRYLTGTLQITAAVLVMIPRTFMVGIALLSCTMVGAMLAWVRLGSPGSALFPGIILLILLAIGAMDRVSATRRP